MADPFHYFHLSDLNITINIDNLSLELSSNLALYSLSTQFDSTIERRVIRELRGRREKARLTRARGDFFGEMGNLASTIERQQDYWPRFEGLAYDIDSVIDFTQITSAQLVMIINARTPQKLVDAAESEFYARRERDFGRGLKLPELVDPRLPSPADSTIQSLPPSPVLSLPSRIPTINSEQPIASTSQLPPPIPLESQNSSLSSIKRPRSKSPVILESTASNKRWKPIPEVISPPRVIAQDMSLVTQEDMKPQLNSNLTMDRVEKGKGKEREVVDNTIETPLSPRSIRLAAMEAEQNRAKSLSSSRAGDYSRDSTISSTVRDSSRYSATGTFATENQTARRVSDKNLIPREVLSQLFQLLVCRIPPSVTNRQLVEYFKEDLIIGISYGPPVRDDPFRSFYLLFGSSEDRNESFNRHQENYFSYTCHKPLNCIKKEYVDGKWHWPKSHAHFGIIIALESGNWKELEEFRLTFQERLLHVRAKLPLKRISRAIGTDNRGNTGFDRRMERDEIQDARDRNQGSEISGSRYPSRETFASENSSDDRLKRNDKMVPDFIICNLFQLLIFKIPNVSNAEVVDFFNKDLHLGITFGPRIKSSNRDFRSIYLLFGSSFDREMTTSRLFGKRFPGSSVEMSTIIKPATDGKWHFPLNHCLEGALEAIEDGKWEEFRERIIIPRSRGLKPRASERPREKAVDPRRSRQTVSIERSDQIVELERNSKEVLENVMIDEDELEAVDESWGVIKALSFD